MQPASTFCLGEARKAHSFSEGGGVRHNRCPRQPMTPTNFRRKEDRVAGLDSSAERLRAAVRESARGLRISIPGWASIRIAIAVFDFDVTLAVEVLDSLMLVAQPRARGAGHAGNGCRAVMNDGSDGPQTAGHLYMHVLAVPALRWPPG